MTGAARNIGRYGRAEKIGQGGFASVYRATDADHGREVAIKVIHGSLGDTEKRRFDRERQAMGRLSAHPNIIAVHDSGYTEEGEAFIVMELAAGGSLQERLDARGALPWTEAVEIMVAIARATDAAHDFGVFHRDIKPDNILVDTFRNPKLSDFGIASVASNATATTSTTATLAHASPEVLEGHPPTPAVDVYALGSTLHNLVSGRAPFVLPTDETAAGVVRRTLMDQPPDLRPLGVPDAVANVIERAMQKEPGQRQSSPSEFADALETAATSAATSSPTPGAAGETRPIDGSPTDRAMAAGPQPGVAQRPDIERSGEGRTATVPPIAGDAPPHLNDGHLAARPGEPPGQTPSRGGSNRGLLVVIGVLVALLIGLVAVVALVVSSDDGENVAASEGSETTVEVVDNDEQASQTSAPSSSATTATSTTTTTTTTAPIVVRDLTSASSASASSSSGDGNDTCGAKTTFGPENTLDNDRTTAWRTAGDGRGEWLEFNLGSTAAVTSVGLVPGYAKVDVCDGVDRFSQNRRIVAVRWTVGTQTIDQVLDPDKPQMQTVSLAEPMSTDTIRLEIISTTADGGRNFTAISDIEILGG